MLGIVNKESFEAFHAKLFLVKGNLRSMPSITGRVKVTSSRTQSLLKKESMELTLQVEAGTTGEKTGKQSKKRACNSDAGVRFITTTFGTETMTTNNTPSFPTTPSSTRKSTRITTCILDHRR